MNVTFGPQKDIYSVYTSPDAGHFALDQPDPMKPLHWDHCREQFAPRFQGDVTGFLFSHPLGRSLNVAALILKTEEVLEITSLDKPHEYSRFSLTNKSNIIWFEPSTFWRECWMKRSIITILLRCGMVYDPNKDNYEDSLFGMDYGKGTDKIMNFWLSRMAFMRFLYGFTKYVGPCPGNVGFVQKEGWHSTFSILNGQEVKKLLVFPGEKYEPCLIGLESIWS